MSGGGRKRGGDLGLEEMRSARTAARPAMALGGSIQLEPKLLMGSGCDVSRSGLMKSVDVMQGVERPWPEVVCPTRKDIGRVPQSLVEVRPSLVGCVSTVDSDGMAALELVDEPVSAVNQFDAATGNMAADAASRCLAAGAADRHVAAGCISDEAGDVMAGVEMVAGSVSMVSMVHAATSSMAAGAASRSVVAGCVSDELVDNTSKLVVGVNNLATNATRFLGDVPNRDSGANSLCKPFGFGLADLANDELRSMVIGATTYADMLRSQSQSGSWADDAEEDLFTDADASYIPGRCGLNLKFSKRVLDALDRNWRYAVIVNLMGKPSSKNVFEFVLRGLRRKWLSKGCWKLIDLPKDYFVVNFELEEDMLKALCDGPWVLGGHTLVVRRWCATFNPLTDVVRSMAVWARVEGLPLRYFTDFAMTKIGKLIGEEVVKVDDVTTQKVRGRYGRVCVEIDLNKPFKSIIEVEDVLYKVRYEGLDHLCFKCGMYGHADESCLVGKVQMEVDSEGCEGPSGHACEGGNRNKVEEIKVVDKEVVDDGFGPWMIMDYKNKKRNAKVSETKPMSSKGSRFSVLDVEGDAGPPKTTPDASFAMAITLNPSSVPATSNLRQDTNDPEIDNEKMEVVVDLVREEAPSEFPRAPPRDLPSAFSSKTKGSIKRSKSSLKLSSKSMVSKARGPPPTPHPSRRLVAENYDRSEGAFQGSHGRSPSEKARVTTEVPSFEDGVKGIVARFEGADTTHCRDSSFPFCSSSHAG